MHFEEVPMRQDQLFSSAKWSSACGWDRLPSLPTLFPKRVGSDRGLGPRRGKTKQGRDTSKLFKSGPISGRGSSTGTPPCPCGIAYRRAYGSSTYGAFQNHFVVRCVLHGRAYTSLQWTGLCKVTSVILHGVVFPDSPDL